MLAPALFEHLRSRGIPVWFMLVNEERELELAHKYGATGVLTDRPRWLTERMQERKIRFKKIE
jgi:glycerophosphoryl diester phosphodiesterase